MQYCFSLIILLKKNNRETQNGDVLTYIQTETMILLSATFYIWIDLAKDEGWVKSFEPNYDDDLYKSVGKLVISFGKGQRNLSTFVILANSYS